MPAMPSRRSFFALLPAGLALVAGCREPITDIALDDWEPEVAVPLLTTRFTLADALTGAEFADDLTTDDDGLIRLSLEADLFDEAPGAILDFEEVLLPLLDTAAAYTPEELDVPYGVTYVELGAGTIVAAFVNDRPVPLEVSLSVPDIVADGSAYARTFTVPPFGSFEDELAVAQVQLGTGASGLFELGYTATTPTGERVQAAAGALAIRTAGYTYAEGRFAGMSVDLSRDSILLDMLGAFEVGSVELAEPSITITVENETGVPLLVSSPEAFVAGREGDSVSIESELRAGVRVDAAAPQDSFSTTRIVVDGANSNFADVVNRFPEALIFALRGAADVDATNRDDYPVRRSDRLRGHLAFDAPLGAHFRRFRLHEQFDFDASQLANARSATFSMLVANEFELAVDAQVYFYDAVGEPIDSLFAAPRRIVEASRTADGGEPDPARAALKTPGLNKLSIPLTEHQLERLPDTRSASVLLYVTSPEGGDRVTTLRADDEMSVQLGVVVGVDPETLP